MPADRPTVRVEVRPRAVLEAGGVFAALVLVFSRGSGLGRAAALAAIACAVVIGVVVLHEAAHAVIARRRGLRVHAVEFRGLITAAVRRSRSTEPRTDLAVSLAGPVVNVALLAPAALLLGRHGGTAVAGYTMLAANLVALAGALPPFPRTDGTRALAAWRAIRRGDITSRSEGTRHGGGRRGDRAGRRRRPAGRRAG